MSELAKSRRPTAPKEKPPFIIRRLQMTDNEKTHSAAPLDIDSTPTIATAIILGTIGVLSFIVQPGLVQGFVVELGLSEVEANDLAFAEMLGVAIATYLTAIASRSVSWRRLVTIGLALAVVGNFASALIGDPFFFRFARFVTGLGEGAIISLSFTVIGLTQKTERNLALYLVLLLTYGAFGLWVMPQAFNAIGLNGIFVAWAILTALAFITVRHVPRSVESRTIVSNTAAQLSTPLLIIALLGILLYNTAIGIAWANLFLIGMEIRPDEQAIANALLLAQFVAIAGALIPVFMETRLGRWRPLVIGIFGGAAFIALLLGDPTYLIFAVAVCGFNFMWNFVLPFILSSISDMETRGEIMTRAIAMQMTGLGFGPFFAARILGEGGGFETVELATITLLIISFVLLAIAKVARRRALAANLHAQSPS